MIIIIINPKTSYIMNVEHNIEVIEETDWDGLDMWRRWEWEK